MNDRMPILRWSLILSLIAIVPLTGCRSGAGWRSFGWNQKSAETEAYEADVQAESYPQYDESYDPSMKEVGPTEGYYPVAPPAAPRYSDSPLRQMSFFFLPKKDKNAGSVREPIESEQQLVPRPKSTKPRWPGFRLPWQQSKTSTVPKRQQSAQIRTHYPRANEVNWSNEDSYVQSSILDSHNVDIALTSGELTTSEEINAEQAKGQTFTIVPQTGRSPLEPDMPVRSKSATSNRVVSNRGANPGQTSQIEDWPYSAKLRTSDSSALEQKFDNGQVEILPGFQVHTR